MAFATKIFLVALDKLHETLATSVDEANDQEIFQHIYPIIHHLYIIIKINNLQNDM
jgi:hypothetical protein